MRTKPRVAAEMALDFKGFPSKMRPWMIKRAQQIKQRVRMRLR
jgi:hypothetical protein